MSRRVLCLPCLLIVALSLLAAGPARGSAPGNEDRGLLLRSGDGEPFAAPSVGTAVSVRVTGIVARTRVTQVFVNPTRQWVEGIYVFPLADGAVVDSLRMTIGDRVLTGVVREKQQAAAVYEQAKQQGHRASLVEMLRPGVFNAAVANLGPGETVEIALEMQQVVEYGRGRFGLRFPLVVPPRYAPRQEDALPIPAPVAGGAAPVFSFRMDLEPGFPLGRVASPSHAVTVTRDERGRRYRVELAAGVAPADADFLLEWTPAVGRRPTAVHFTETVGDERYALLMVLPPDAPEAAAARLPRETVFVIDTSYSMEGTSLEQARQALLLGLDRLAPGDAFNVIRFASTASALFPASVPADPAAIERAKAWVRSLEVDGGTEMLFALKLALPSPISSGGGLLRQVIFATDGQVSGEAELLRFIAEHLGQSRLYSVAIGSAPNAAFLRRAAALGRGTFTSIESADRVTAGMDDLFARIEAPMLRDVAVQWADPQAEAWPERVPDLYLGEPIVVTARLHGDAGPVSVEGMQGHEPWRDAIPAAGEVRGAGLDKLWAGRKVQALLDGIAGGANTAQVQREVTALALRHRLLTPYTSFVVVEETPVRPLEVTPLTCRIPGAVARDAAPAPAPPAPPATPALDPDVDGSGVEDVITVTAESPLLDERRIATGATVAQTELEKIPTARDPWAILQSTPGVLADRTNVGGNATGEQSRYVGPGSPMEQSTWSMDGVVMTDMAALGSPPAYYDFDAFEEVQVATGGSDSTAATGGVALNMVTKRGTNEWRGSGRLFLADGGWGTGTRVAGSDLGGPGPWNADAAHPDGSTQEAIAQDDRNTRAADYGAEVGGPIVRDRLWVWGSYGVQQADRPTPSDRPSSTNIAVANLKLNAQLAVSNSAALFALGSDKARRGGDAGPFRPLETTWSESRLGPAATAARVEDTHIVTSSLYVTGLLSIVDGGFQLAPRGGTERTAFQDAQGVWRNTYDLYRTEREQRQLKGDVAHFFTTSHVSHELKLSAGRRESESRSLSRWGGAGYAVAAESLGTPDDVLFAARDASSAVTTDSTGAYVQDTLTVGNLTANVGVRYDLQRGELGARSVRANPVFPDLLPAATSAGGDAGLAWESIAPRLGVTWAVGAERKTLLRASYSRFADQLGAEFAGHLYPLALPSSVYFLVGDAGTSGGLLTRGDVVDRNGDSVVDLADGLGFGGAYDPAGGGVLQRNGVDPELDPPTTREMLVSAEHALRPEFVVGLELTWRRLTGLLERELLVFDGDPYAPENLSGIGRRHRAADYEPVTVTRPGGLPGGQTYAYTYWQLRRGVATRGGTWLENGGREQEYRGASLTLDKRLINRWMMRGNVTWSDWTWKVPAAELEDRTRSVGGGFDGEPVLHGPSGAGSGPLGEGGVFIQSRWSYDLNALYQVAPARRWGFDVAASVSGREGYPVPWFERLGLGQRRGIAGTTDVQVVANDRFHLDDVHVLDAGVEKDFVFRDLGLAIGIDCFNVLGARTVLQRHQRLGVGASPTDPLAPASGFATELLDARTFRVGLRVSFR
jgi:Ca-activated chloride channel family protein